MNTSNTTPAKLVLLVALSALGLGKDGRSFYTAEFQDPSNPFAKTVKRNFWQQFDGAGNPVWKGADYEKVGKFIGKSIPGEIMTKEVVPYTIAREGKEDYLANTYTTVVLGGELASVTFKSLGHELAQTAPTVIAPEQPVNADQMPII